MPKTFIVSPPFTRKPKPRWHPINCAAHAVHTKQAPPDRSTASASWNLTPLIVFLILSITFFAATSIGSRTHRTTPTRIDGRVPEPASAIALIDLATGTQANELVHEPVDPPGAAPAAAPPRTGPYRSRQIATAADPVRSGPHAHAPSRRRRGAGPAGAGQCRGHPRAALRTALPRPGTSRRRPDPDGQDRGSEGLLVDHDGRLLMFLSALSSMPRTGFQSIIEDFWPDCKFPIDSFLFAFPSPHLPPGIG